MKSKRPGRSWSVLAAALLVAVIVGCASDRGRRTAAREAARQIDSADLMADRGSRAEALARYCAALGQLAQSGRDPEQTLLSAAVFHRFHVLDATAVHGALPADQREGCAAFARILEERGPSPDFLGMSFSQLLVLDTQLGGIPDERVEPWLRVVRDVIVGDIFARRAARVSEDPARARDATVPRACADGLQRWHLADVAKSYYLRAWMRAAEGRAETSGARNRVKAIDSTMAATARSLALLPGRTDEFRNAFMRSAEALEKEQRDLDAAEDVASVASRPDEAYLRLDPETHLREGREDVVEGVRRRVENQPARAVKAFQSALKHLLYARELGIPAGSGAAIDLEALLDDVLSNLQMLTEQR
ncbi:MAG: hypothetical protein HYY93_00150 [Planctomycetes bacterium]|nr:hypothetical protein [Planctomycetota bacterium]